MADRCDILGSDGFRCVLWLGHRGTHEFDTYQNPLLTDRDRDAVRAYRRLWENRLFGPRYEWISRETLEYIKPLYRHYRPSEALGTVIRIESFGQESAAWRIVGYDHVRDWYYMVQGDGRLSELEQAREEAEAITMTEMYKKLDWLARHPTQVTSDNSPRLGGRSGLSGREPMLSRKAKK